MLEVRFKGKKESEKSAWLDCNKLTIEEAQVIATNLTIFYGSEWQTEFREKTK